MDITWVTEKIGEYAKTWEHKADYIKFASTDGAYAVLKYRHSADAANEIIRKLEADARHLKGDGA